MYHSVDDDKCKKIALPAESFCRQMEYLSSKGYQTLTLDQFYNLMTTGQKIPRKSIILTFDDGYDDSYSVVFPILRKYNFVANFFITTNYVGTTKVFDWDEKISNRRMILSWKEVKEMSDCGMVIGSHTCTHRLLTQIPLKEARYEVETSKAVIESKINKPVNFLSYPKNDFNEKIKKMVKIAGYCGACATRLSINNKQDIFSLERTGIYKADNIISFRTKLLPVSRILQRLEMINSLGRALFQGRF